MTEREFRSWYMREVWLKTPKGMAYTARQKSPEIKARRRELARARNKKKREMKNENDDNLSGRDPQLF